MLLTESKILFQNSISIETSVWVVIIYAYFLLWTAGSVTKTCWPGQLGYDSGYHSIDQQKTDQSMLVVNSSDFISSAIWIHESFLVLKSSVVLLARGSFHGGDLLDGRMLPLAVIQSSSESLSFPWWLLTSSRAQQLTEQQITNRIDPAFDITAHCTAVQWTVVLSGRVRWVFFQTRP